MGLLDWEPLPDWITYLTTAENMTCPPWEMFEPAQWAIDPLEFDDEGFPVNAGSYMRIIAGDVQPPKWWWREARMIFDAGRNEGEKKRQAQRK
jgi:hypothetical protein